MRKPIIALVTLVAVVSLARVAQAAPTELTWYGHAAFKLTTPSGKTILIDPWITNPLNKSGKEDVAKLTKVDLILISHGHFDHVGDAVAIAKKTGARLVATFDLGNALVRFAGYPKEQFGFETGGNFGGELSLYDGEVKIRFVPAVHSSTVAEKMGTPDEQPRYGGAAGGFVVSVKGGPTIYHTGDTDVFGDMALIGAGHKVTLMLACIGDHFVMGPERAADAVKLVGAPTVVPMHFGTFPVLNGTPDEFAKALKAKAPKAKMQVMTIGEPIKL